MTLATSTKVGTNKGPRRWFFVEDFLESSMRSAMACSSWRSRGCDKSGRSCGAADLLNLKWTNAMFLLQLSWMKHSSSMSCSCLRSTSQTGRMCTAVTPARAMDRQRAARMWCFWICRNLLDPRVITRKSWTLEAEICKDCCQYWCNYHCVPLHRRLEDKIWAGKYCSAFHEASLEGNDSSL